MALNKEKEKKSLNERETQAIRAEEGEKKVLHVLKLISYSNDSYTNDQFILFAHCTHWMLLLKDEN